MPLLIIHSHQSNLNQATYVPETSLKPDFQLGLARLSDFPCHGLFMYFAPVTFLIGSGCLGWGSDSGEEGGWWAGSLRSACTALCQSQLWDARCSLLALHSPCLVDNRDLEGVCRNCFCPAQALCSLVSYPAATQAFYSWCHFLTTFQLKPSTSSSKAAPALEAGQAEVVPRWCSDFLSHFLKKMKFFQL